MVEFETDEEILELAISREEDAHVFLLTLAGRMVNPEMRKVFEDLADEELEHKARLELEVIKKGRVVTATKQLQYEAKDYAEPAGTDIDIDMDYKDILIMAMQKEEASFRLYVDLASRVTHEDAYETLLALAEEEVRHKLRFEMEYDNLLKAG